MDDLIVYQLRKDYLRKASCGHLPMGQLTRGIFGDFTCDRCLSCDRVYNIDGLTFYDAIRTETHIIMLPIICPYSEV